MNKYLYSSNKLDFTRSLIHETESNSLDYKYFIYDSKAKLIQGKKLSLNSSEKNEVFWSKYDMQLNDLQNNIVHIKFKNEMRFVVIDKMEDYMRKKRKPVTKYTVNSAQTNLLSHGPFNSANLSLGNITNSGYLSNTPKNSIIDYSNFGSYPSSPKLSSVDLLKTSQIFHKAQDPSETIPTFNELKQDGSIEENPIFSERVKQFIQQVDGYLSKYDKNYDKLSSNIVNVTTEELNKIREITHHHSHLYASIFYIQQPTDWMLLLHNKYFNDRRNLYLAINWLSCNSMSIHNFHKDLIKKVNSIQD